MKGKGQVTSVTINDEYMEEMDRLKNEHGLSKRYLINSALKEYFENHLDELNSL